MPRTAPEVGRVAYPHTGSRMLVHQQFLLERAHGNT